MAGERRSLDKMGCSFPHEAAARHAAIRFAGEYIRDHPEAVTSSPNLRVQVTNEREELVYTLMMTSIEARTDNSNDP